MLAKQAPGIDPNTGRPFTQEGPPIDVSGALNERDVHLAARVGALDQPKAAKVQKKTYLDKKESNIRDIEKGEDYPAALEAAREGNHLRKTQGSGEYIGGPPGVRTQAHLDAARAEHDRLAKLGAEEGMDWYDEVAADFERMFRDPEAADRFARAHAHTSARAKPPENANEATKAYNAAVLGKLGWGVATTPRSRQSSIRGRALQGSRCNSSSTI